MNHAPVIVRGPLAAVEVARVAQAAVDVFKVHLSTDLVGFSQSLQS